MCADSVCRKLEKFVSDPDFEPDKVAYASNAAAGMCKWVRAMVTYHHVAKHVAPKKKRLAEATAALEKAEAVLTAKKEELAGVMALLDSLNKQLEAAKAREAQLADDVENCKVKLDRAQQLTHGLGVEKKRYAVPVFASVHVCVCGHAVA